MSSKEEAYLSRIDELEEESQGHQAQMEELSRGGDSLRKEKERLEKEPNPKS